MAFFNEYMSDADVRDFNIVEIDAQYRKGSYRPAWTFDRERKIYLRWMSAGREENSLENLFTFYWEGNLIRVELISRNPRDYGDGKSVRVWDMQAIDIPASIKNSELAIISDLKEALVAFGDFGVASLSSSHEVLFLF